jgi:hypothetical protein
MHFFLKHEEVEVIKLIKLFVYNFIVFVLLPNIDFLFSIEFSIILIKAIIFSIFRLIFC